MADDPDMDPRLPWRLGMAIAPEELLRVAATLKCALIVVGSSAKVLHRRRSYRPARAER
jgi:hypothetical protein